MRCVHDRRLRAETTRLRQQLDRAEAVLGEALLDLARLLVGVDVERQCLGGGVPAELLEPLPRARAYGVGREADADAGLTHRLELREVVGDRLLPETVDAAARVGDVEEDELDPGFGCGLGGREGLRETEVVELADHPVARVQHLAVDLDVAGAQLLDGQALRQREHRVAPTPEVVALRAAAQGALERVRMGVDEPWQRERVGHRRILPSWRHVLFQLR